MRILIVDDERAALASLTKMLEPLGEVVATESGQESLDAFARALAEGKPFNLVSMDIVMPGLDGQATLQAMRDLEKRHAVPPGQEAKVMMVTGLGDAGNVTRAFFKGQADGYITKPLQKAALLKTLRGMGIAIG
ncbi:MAG: response regulator [Proteobacteria bacterium]|nr:response regulator [Pseudomonadota bacterium]